MTVAGAPAAGLPAAWRHARAALLLFVVALHLFAAAPLPRSVRRSQYEGPMARDEVARWVELLAAVGVRRTPEELVEASYRSGVFWSELRRSVLRPFDGVFRVTGTGQGWGLFTYPDTYPHRLTVWARPRHDAPWEVLYAALDAAHDWRRPWFAYRRIRGVYDGQTAKPGPSYETFARWAAGLAFDDVPWAAEVRVGFVRAHTTEPGRTPDPTTTQRNLRTFTREELDG